MEQNKKDENFAAIGNKSLLFLSESNVSPCALKLLDVYLSKIDLHNPENREVRFEKDEIQNILGVDKIKKDALKKKLGELFASITIKNTSNPQRLLKMSLFETAIVSMNEEGNWSLNLSCTETAMKYILGEINCKPI